MPEEKIPTTYVTGRRERSEDGSVNWSYLRSTNGTPGTRDVTPQSVSENPEMDQILEITVTIEQTDGTTDNERTAAAARAVILAIARARDALKASNPSRLISVNGVAISLGALLSALNNTDFTVTDRSDASFGNGGVGAAVYNPLGRHSSTITYRAVGGDPANPSAGYYNHPRFNGLGMLAIVLHEAFHVTPEGHQWHTETVQTFRSLFGPYQALSGPSWDRHRANLERLINTATIQALVEVGQPYDPANPPFADMDPPIDPETVT